MTEKWLVCGGRNFGDVTQRDKLDEINQAKLVKLKQLVSNDN